MFQGLFFPVSSTNQTDLHDNLNIAKSGVKYHKPKQQQIRLCCNNTYNEMGKQIFSLPCFLFVFLILETSEKYSLFSTF